MPSAPASDYDPDPIAGVPTERLVRGGLCVIPEGRGIFPNLTVTENLKMASFSGASYADILEKSFQFFPKIAERRNQLAGKQDSRLWTGWIAPGTLEAMKPGRMQGHGGTEEVPG